MPSARGLAGVIRAIVADDEALVCSGIRMILEEAPDIEVVAEARDGAEATRMVNEHLPDVLLMDVRMPGVDGLQATRQIVAAHGEAVRILVLTTFDTDEYVYEALRAGANGFLLKSEPPERLVQAVRMVAQGEALLAPSITRRLIERFVSRPQPGKHHPGIERLTEREMEVLGLIARGLSNSEIARELYLSEGTVKTHVNRILTKLSLRDRVQAVVLAYEAGLAKPGESGETP